MTDLSPAERLTLMDMVYFVESQMRHILQPQKINLASFGTMVPHQHWHVIARFSDDAYYPDSIWSQAHHQNIPSLPIDWVQRLQTALNAHQGVNHAG